MFVLMIKIKLYIEWSFSLKDKRRIRYRLRDRMKNRYNISIMEIGHNDSIKNLKLGITAVSLTESQSIQLAEKLKEFVIENSGAEIDIYEYDIIKY